MRFIELKQNEYVNLDVVAMIDINTKDRLICIYAMGNQYFYSDVSPETIEKLKQLLGNN